MQWMYCQWYSYPSFFSNSWSKPTRTESVSFLGYLLDFFHFLYKLSFVLLVILRSGLLVLERHFSISLLFLSLPPSLPISLSSLFCSCSLSLSMNGQSKAFIVWRWCLLSGTSLHVVYLLLRKSINKPSRKGKFISNILEVEITKKCVYWRWVTVCTLKFCGKTLQWTNLYFAIFWCFASIGII